MASKRLVVTTTRSFIKYFNPHNNLLVLEKNDAPELADKVNALVAILGTKKEQVISTHLYKTAKKHFTVEVLVALLSSHLKRW